MRGPSVAGMQDFMKLKRYFLVETESYVAIGLSSIGFYPPFGCISQRARVIVLLKATYVFVQNLA